MKVCSWSEWFVSGCVSDELESDSEPLECKSESESESEFASELVAGFASERVVRFESVGFRWTIAWLLLGCLAL